MILADLDAIQAALVAALKASPRDNYGPEFIDDLPYVNLWETGTDAQRVSLCIDDTFDADKLATHLHASLIAPLEARITELEAERDDLADELDNVRSAFRDRWGTHRVREVAIGLEPELQFAEQQGHCRSRLPFR